MTLSVDALAVVPVVTPVVAGTAPYAGEPGQAAISHPEPYLSTATLSALTCWIDGSDTISESFSALPGWALADDTGIQEKFEPDLYWKVHNLVASQSRQESATCSAVPSTYHDIVILVAARDADGNDISEASKRAVTDLLTAVGARNVSAAQTLSFVTASVPVAAINSVSLYGEVFLTGDGQRELVHAMSGARRTVNAISTSLGGTDGTGVTVAVLDDGINHSSLNGKTTHVKRASTECTVITDLAGINSSNNQVTHGTAVAQVAAGREGIAPDANLLDIDSFGSGTTLVFCRALDWAITCDADAVNYSVSHIISKKSSCDLPNLAVHHVANEAINLGMFIVGVVRNDAAVNGTIAYKTVRNPGCATGVLTVGGIDDRRDVLGMCHDSGRGPVLDNIMMDMLLLLLPLLLLLLLKPETVASAVNITISGLFIVENDSSYFAASGTGRCSTHGDRYCTLLLEEDGELDTRQLRAALPVWADWKGPIPCTSVQFEAINASDNCSRARQPTDQIEANGPGSPGILNSVGFGVLNVGQSLNYVRNGDHIVSGSLGTVQNRTRFLKVDDPDKPLKAILSWNGPTQILFNDMRTSLTDVNLTAGDMGLEVACSGMDTVIVDSRRQVNEFAVFTPARASTCTATVTADFAAEYVLASTGSFVDEGAFVTTWTVTGNAKTISTPLEARSGEQFYADWGDDTTDIFETDGTKSHTSDVQCGGTLSLRRQDTAFGEEIEFVGLYSRGGNACAVVSDVGIYDGWSAAL